MKKKRKPFYPQGKLCICSVQKKEEGFEDYRYAAYLAAEALGFEAIRNPEREGMTQEEFELCLKTEYPVFILIIGTKNSEVVNREFEIALEKCLPILLFIKEQNGKISSRTKQIVVKSSEVTFNYNGTKFSNCEDLYDQVYERLQCYINEKNAKRSILQKGVQLAYRSNIDLMKKAKKQIIIYQETSILLLGPRRGCSYETEFYKVLTEWLKNKNKNNINFVHVFNWDKTLDDARTNERDYNFEVAQENILNLFEQNEEVMNIRYSDIRNSVPYVITDTNLVFIFPIENERYSIELPARILKYQEIEALVDDMTRQTNRIERDRILQFYNEVRKK